MAKVIRLTELEIERLVKKIVSEERKQQLNEDQRFANKLHELSDIYDDLVYLGPGYHNEGNYVEALGIYKRIKQVINGENIPKEAEKIINSIDSDISVLEGLDQRVVQLYEILDRTFLN